MSLPIKRSFSSEGGAARRDWKTRLSLRSRSGHSADALRGRRCASLRSAATPLRTDESGRSTPSVTHRASPSPADTPAPKKSNWEVIEHFSSNRSKKNDTAVEVEGAPVPPPPQLPLCPAGKPDVDGQPLLGDDPRPEQGAGGADDEEEEEEEECCQKCIEPCPGPIRAVCATHRFENLHVEMLYQRYFLRMNQNNMTHLLGLLLGIAITLAFVQVRTLFIAEDFLATIMPSHELSFQQLLELSVWFSNFNNSDDPNRPHGLQLYANSACLLPK